MAESNIFEMGKELAMKRGKHKDFSTYVGACSVGGDFSIYKDTYTFKKKGLKIKYSTGSFDDGSGKWEGLEIHYRESFFGKRKEVYNFFVKEGKGRELLVNINREWLSKLEKLFV